MNHCQDEMKKEVASGIILTAALLHFHYIYYQIVKLIAQYGEHDQQESE
jgi:hypothetical protein